MFEQSQNWSLISPNTINNSTPTSSSSSSSLLSCYSNSLLLSNSISTTDNHRQQHKQQLQASYNNNNQQQNKQQQQQHSEYILNGLQTLKANNILCDVTLIAQNKRFQVHKVLLASVSDYFRSMFTSGMKESTQSDIELKGVTSRGLEKLIEIIYTSKTTFDSHTDLFEVISSANHLQCLIVLDYCEKNFLSRLTCKNFNYFIQMAKMYRMQNALKQIDLFIVNNLAQIINQSNRNKRFKLEHDSYVNNNNNAVNSKKDNDKDHESERNNELVDNPDNHDTYDDHDDDDDDDENSDLTGLNSLSYEQLIKCLTHDNLRLKEIDLFILTWQWINETLFKQYYFKNKNSKLKKKKYKSSSSSSSFSSLSYSCLDSSLDVRVKVSETKFKRKIDIIRSLMKHIRFALITPNDLVKKVQTINKLMLNDKYLRKLVLNGLNYHILAVMTPNLNLKIRCPVNSIFIIGGREINPSPSLHDSCFLLNDLLSFNSNFDTLNSTQKSLSSQTTPTIRKIPYTSIPNSLSHMQCVLVENNFLYVIGGCLSQCAHGESAVNTTYRYDPRLNKWMSTKAMIEKRAYFYACSLKAKITNNSDKIKEFIYSFGGKNKDGSLSSVEKYDIETNTWSYTHPMPSTYYAHTGAVLNNLAYISGGYTHGHFTPDLHSFNPNTEQWDELRPMNVSRGWHSICVANDLLYVFGGCYLNGSQPQPNQAQVAQPVTVTEYYSPLTDQWTIVRPMINLHKEASCFKINNYIYIFGGYNITAKTGQKLISKYDFTNDIWYTIGQLPSGMTGVGCCLIDLPWHMVEKENNEIQVQSFLSSSSEQTEFIQENEQEHIEESDQDDESDNKTSSYISSNDDSYEEDEDASAADEDDQDNHACAHYHRNEYNHEKNLNPNLNLKQ